MSRDVVVTGLGVVSPIGTGIAAFEAALLEGRTNVTPIDIFDATAYRTRIAQTVSDELRGPGDPAVAFALRAAEEAVAHARLDETTLRACGLALATTAAGWTAGQRLFEAVRNDEEASLPPEALFKEAVPRGVASRFGLRGPCALLSPACAAASSAIAWAAQRIRDGDASVMLAGASDALTEVVFAGFHAMRLLVDDACRPFSAGRRGLVLSEGAAMLVLEVESHARARNATILARLSGWGLSCDAAHPTTPGSGGVLRAMRTALNEAGIEATAVDQISAHGTGSMANDAAEAQAIAALLGERVADVPFTAIKGTTGHTEGAAGAFGALAAVLSLQSDRLPPLTGFRERDPALPPLRLVLNGPQRHEGRNVLVNASGFGGANAALVFEKPTEPARSAKRPTRRAVITARVVMTECGMTECGEDVFWPGGRSLMLDRVSARVMAAAKRLLGPPLAKDIDPNAAVVLGTTYGSQSRHESMWRALAEGGPRAVEPNDFALSTFNAPGSAVASAYGFGGANLIFLGPTGGTAAIEEATRLVAAGHARRVLTGAYEEVTPYFRCLMSALGECHLGEAVALLLIEDEEEARGREVPALARVIGHASRAPDGHWPGVEAFSETMRSALDGAGIEPGDLGAIILDPHDNARAAQFAAVDVLFGDSVTLIDPLTVYGNCLSASTPLALNLAIASAASGHWLDETVLRGPATYDGRPVLINACGLMSGCAALVVLPCARV
jgi:3-oxoacyl-[acyl-carrier-protein] synthase II